MTTYKYEADFLDRIALHDTVFFLRVSNNDTFFSRSNYFYATSNRQIADELVRLFIEHEIYEEYPLNFFVVGMGKPASTGGIKMVKDIWHGIKKMRASWEKTASEPATVELSHEPLVDDEAWLYHLYHLGERAEKWEYRIQYALDEKAKLPSGPYALVFKPHTVGNNGCDWPDTAFLELADKTLADRLSAILNNKIYAMGEPENGHHAVGVVDLGKLDAAARDLLRCEAAATQGDSTPGTTRDAGRLKYLAETYARTLEPGTVQAAEGVADHSDILGEDAADEYRNADWFTRRNFPADRLRQAAKPERKTKRVRHKTIGGVKCYHVGDVRQYWPDDLKELT